MHDYVHALDPGSGRAVTSAYPLIHEQDSKFLHNLDVTGCSGESMLRGQLYLTGTPGDYN